MNSQTVTDRSLPTLRTWLLEGVERLRGAGIESARIDAEVLLCHCLAASRTDLYSRFEQTLSANAIELFQSLLERRATQEPIAYITGVKEFWSLDFAVDRRVLIPRPETELLVEWTIARAQTINSGRPLKILDLGTGSGAIAVALAAELPHAQIWAVDISSAALAIAERNAQRHGSAQRIRFLAGDLFEPLVGQAVQFDMIVSNPPYISRQEFVHLSAEIRAHEPLTALDGGEDGLAYYRRMVAGAPQFLATGGALLCEIGASQGDAVTKLFVSAGGFEAPAIYQDLAGKDRVVAAMKGGVRG